MKKIITILLILFLGSNSVCAQPGSTDAKGGHSDNEGKNHSYNNAKEVARDGQYVKYRSGVIYDEKTGLEWYTCHDKATSWDEARKWAEKLSLDGGGWRIPSKSELKTLYMDGRGTRNMTPLLETTGWWVWSSENYDSHSVSCCWFYFLSGGDVLVSNHYVDAGRAFAVRTRKPPP